MNRLRALAVWPLVTLCAAANADESLIQLKDAPGKAKVIANCSACHSLDYIQMNSPFPDRKLWAAEINKMMTVFGAPISKEDAVDILDYLVKNYGTR